MDIEGNSALVEVIRFKDAVFVRFEDNVAALYSVSLLREMLPKAEIIDEAPDQAEPED